MLRLPCQRLLARVLGYSPCSCSVVQSVPSAWLRQQGRTAADHKQYSSPADGDDYSQEVDLINEKFAEAREEIEFAREDAETVYFNESAQTAREAVAGVLQRWDSLLSRLTEEDQAKLQRSMGLKLEQLKAELKELDEMHA